VKSHSDLVKGIIRDLNKVELVLLFQTIEKGSEEEALLCELKSATDNLRTSTWGHMRASETEENGTRSMMEYHRTRRVAQSAQQYPVYARASNLRDASLVEKFEGMAETALQDHLAMATVRVN
jgi:hypothetical protein